MLPSRHLALVLLLSALACKPGDEETDSDTSAADDLYYEQCGLEPTCELFVLGDPMGLENLECVLTGLSHRTPGVYGVDYSFAGDNPSKIYIIYMIFETGEARTTHWGSDGPTHASRIELKPSQYFEACLVDLEDGTMDLSDSTCLIGPYWLSSEEIEPVCPGV